MLLELAIGDAYGAGFEYVKDLKFYIKNDLKQYYKHPTHIEIMEGQYTDDTQMTLAIVEMMLSNLDWNPQNIANKFVYVFKRDYRTGYARRFQQFLENVKDGEEFLNKIVPNSDKSGACMRSHVIGLYPDIKEVIEKSTIQAKITHNTESGINASIASSLIVHYLYYQLGAKKDLPLFLNSYLKGKWDEEWKSSVGSKGWMTVKGAITAILKNDNLADILKHCISYTGDVDTVATIAMAGASCSNLIKKNIPYILLNTLENGKYGRDYLESLDKKLLEKFPK